MMTLVSLARFIPLFVFGILPTYFAYAESCSTNITPVFPSLSECAQDLRTALGYPLVGSCDPESAHVFEPSPNSTNTVLATQGIKPEYPVLPDGLANCINSFEQYSFLAKNIIQRRHAQHAKQSPTQKLISSKLGYPMHFDKANKGIMVNAQFAEYVAQVGRQLYDTGMQDLEDNEEADFGLVNLAFGHLMRDWSSLGIQERQVVFPPIMAGLEEHFGVKSMGKKVLVPGSGMGRLASDIADLGTWTLCLKSIQMGLRGCRLRRHG